MMSVIRRQQIEMNTKFQAILFYSFSAYFSLSFEIDVRRALTSGTGVALALLLGAAGPLIGVAISASLLPPVVNCVSRSFTFYKFFQRNLLPFFA